MIDAYFDNAATTPVCPEAIAAAEHAIIDVWGNPSAANRPGSEARRLLEESRKTIKDSLGAKSGSIVFTGSGTESDNLAILGTLTAKNRLSNGRKRIITTEDEHPAVLNAFEKAEQLGFEKKLLTVKGGLIDFEELCSLLDESVALVSIMTVNNETGAVYPIGKISELVRKKAPCSILHTDSVQGYMKVDCSPEKNGCDLISISGHKIGGIKGVGALWISDVIIKSRNISPVIFGGGQEGGLRSGTENVPGIAAMAAAAIAYRKSGNVEIIRKTIINGLPGGFETNVPCGEYVPHILSVYCGGIKSEVMVRFLSERGVHVSSGSACSTRKLKTSHALIAFGLSEKRADSTIRISISENNTPDEAEALLAGLAEAKQNLISRR